MTRLDIIPCTMLAAYRAFNMRDLDFLGYDVFKFTDNGETVLFGPSGAQVSYVEPDELRYEPITVSFVTETATLIETESDYDSLFEASISGSMSTATLSGSASSSLMQTISLSSSNSYYASLEWYGQRTVTMERMKTVLHDDFVARVLALTTESTQADYFEFFDDYGTHYVTKVAFGGYFNLVTTVQTTLVETYTSDEVTASLSTGFEGLVGSGSLDTDVLYSTSQFLSDNREDFSFQLTGIGGDLILGEEQSTFLGTTYELGVALLTDRDLPAQFEPISALVSVAGGDDDVAATMEAEIENYLHVEPVEGGLMGSTKGITWSKSEQAVDDAIMCVTTKVPSDSGRITVEGEFGSEVSADDHGSKISADQYNERHEFVNKCASLALPIAKDEYYKTLTTSSSGSTEQAATLTYLLTTEMGGVVPVTNASTTFDSDGILVATVEAEDDGCRGSIVVAVSDGVTGSASCDYSKDGNNTDCKSGSLTIPVQKGEQVTITKSTLAGTPAFTVFFRPFGENVALGNVTEFDFDSIFQADSDGFLTADASTSKMGGKLTLEALVAADAGSVDDAMPRGYVSIVYTNTKFIASGSYSRSRIDHDSLFVPVREGDWFKVKKAEEAGTVNSTMQFTRLISEPVGGTD